MKIKTIRHESKLIPNTNMCSIFDTRNTCTELATRMSITAILKIYLKVLNIKNLIEQDFLQPIFI